MSLPCASLATLGVTYNDTFDEGASRMVEKVARRYYLWGHLVWVRYGLYHVNTDEITWLS